MDTAVQKSINLGRVVSTLGVNLVTAKDAEYSRFVYNSLRRHRKCDWGDLPEETKKLNTEFAKHPEEGRTVVSLYKYKDLDIFIVTDFRQEVTTIMFTNEY